MNNYLSLAIQAALKAGERILQVYNSNIVIGRKSDHSPVTEADLKSHSVIKDALGGTDIPLLSEEGKQTSFEERRYWRRFWLIDPLDGTKEFIKHNGEFTVNIALIENGSPVLGVVYVPVKKVLYFGTVDIDSCRHMMNDGEFLPANLEELVRLSDKLRDVESPAKYTVVASRSHLSHETEKFIEEKKEQFGDVEIVSAGSSLKICMVAERKAQVYPRLASTMEWDTAAGHAIAKFAGCSVYEFNTRKELQYNKEDLHNPWFVVEEA